MSITLTDEQRHAIDLITAWYNDPLSHQEFKLGGFAGTGKTTIIKWILENLPQVHTVVCAFTGKAVNVLNKKGVLATTMHALMYHVQPEVGGKVSFVLRAFIESQPDLIIVDEASMVSTELYNDIVSFGKKLLFVGDPGQLEPVGDNPELMKTPNFVLAKIHRQAESSPILTLATSVRQGGGLYIQKQPGLWVKSKAITSPEFLSVDQVICAKNATRIGFNKRIRIFMKRPPQQIVVGEKLIVCRNNAEFGVFNGMILFIDSIRDIGSSWECNCHDEISRVYGCIPIWKEPFYNETVQLNPFIPKGTVWCDFGYCITAHKSQGSEWDRVLVWDEVVSGWDMKRWRYTAITRAAKELTVCL